MAQKVTILDDLSGKEGAETFRFTAGGKVYEIDLVEANIQKFWTAIKRFTDKGRDITPAPRNGSDPYASIDRGAVRDWDQGARPVVQREGQVPLDLVYAYKRAMAAAESGSEQADESTAATPSDLQAAS